MGKRTTKLDRMVAVHEAGHAVVAMALRQAFERVTIEPDLPGSLGHVHQPWAKSVDTYSPDGRGRRYIEDRVIVLLAGHRAAKKDAGRAAFGQGADRRSAVELLFILSGSSEEVRAWYALQEVRAKMYVDREWHAIEALAEELLRRRRMTYRQARNVYREAHALPPPPGS